MTGLIGARQREAAGLLTSAASLVGSNDQPHDGRPGISGPLESEQLRSKGPAALVLIAAFANHEEFDRVACLLLDIDLGDGSGIELKRGLDAANISVPVIYMTGNDTPAIREAALASGCIAFLTKPFSTQSLIEPLKKASAGRS